jgi:uncharacterized damage-inducible protein DinB
MSRQFLDASRNYLLDEYVPKIRLAVAPLTDADAWWRPDAGSNSIGNLILHIEGNARQWILGGVAQQAGERDRDAEFSATGGQSTSELIERLARSFQEIGAAILAVPTSEMDAPRVIQGASTTVFHAIYHVVEHVSMHTGQIIQLAKWRAPGALKLYEASSTAFTPLWTPEPRTGVNT